MYCCHCSSNLPLMSISNEGAVSGLYRQPRPEQTDRSGCRRASADVGLRGLIFGLAQWSPMSEAARPKIFTPACDECALWVRCHCARRSFATVGGFSIRGAVGSQCTGPEALRAVRGAQRPRDGKKNAGAGKQRRRNTTADSRPGAVMFRPRQLPGNPRRGKGSCSRHGCPGSGPDTAP